MHVIRAQTTETFRASGQLQTTQGGGRHASELTQGESREGVRATWAIDSLVPHAIRGLERLYNNSVLLYGKLEGDKELRDRLGPKHTISVSCKGTV